MSGYNKINIHQFLEKFKCLGTECPDTCCYGWGMQLDHQTKELYEKQAPELMETVGVDDNTLVMKRDSVTDFCVNFSQGLCNIHLKYGERFLGDACNFYPRTTRKLADYTLMSAVLSCPEVARLVIYGDDPFLLQEISVERLPSKVIDYAQDFEQKSDALTIHNLFMSYTQQVESPQKLLADLVKISRSLDNLNKNHWQQAIEAVLPIIKDFPSHPEFVDTDPFNLINFLIIMISASKKHSHQRLKEMVNIVSKALELTIDIENPAVTLSNNSYNIYQKLKACACGKVKEQLDHIMCRYLQSQINLFFFPFAGLGNSVSDKASIIVVKFALIRLLLLSHVQLQGELDETSVIRIVQTLSRFLDHLTNADLLLLVLKDFGWDRESRLLALLG